MKDLAHSLGEARTLLQAPRKTWDEHFMNIAKECASMGTCCRRQVGCVLIDKQRRIVSTGFNGVPPGWDHCRGNDKTECPGALAPSGTALDGCWANHAEQNALLHCSNRLIVDVCYTTTSPCVTCIKELLHTSCRRIVFYEEYTHSQARDLWLKKGFIDSTRTWQKLGYEPVYSPLNAT